MGHIRHRLDRAILNSEWRIEFPNVVVEHLVINKYDHAPILLRLWGNQNNRPKTFRFDVLESWIYKESGNCDKTIRKNLLINLMKFRKRNGKQDKCG